MPRHPPNALTSRLRVHTTNDNSGWIRRPTRNSAEQSSVVQLVWLLTSALMFGADIPAASAENRTPHGIDLKNPFTMSKTRTPVATGALTAARSSGSDDPTSLDLLKGVKRLACLTARRQSQQSCTLWRTMPRWPSLSEMRISFANSSSRLRIGGAYRDRTDDLMLAKQPLSQLS